MANTLIGSVKVQPGTVRPGESVFVQVCDLNGRPYADNSGVAITIQGIEATARYYQFSTPGTRQLVVRAVKGSIDETSTVTVQVSGAPLEYTRSLGAPVQSAMPIIQATLKLGDPYTATFALNTPNSLQPVLAQQNAQAPAGAAAVKPPAPAAAAAPPAEFLAFSKALTALPVSADAAKPVPKITTVAGVTATLSGALGILGREIIKPAPMATSYKWDFGDGTTITTQSPTATHNYFPAIQADTVAHSFNVSCTVVHDNLTVTRTLVLISAYGISKRLGSVVPHHTGDEFAVFQHAAFSGSMIVHNIEAEAITLNRMAVV
ncbi:MAG: PKD domain-containing protein, partial [Bryobacteraceae bacterium]